MAEDGSKPILEIEGLHVYYGASHAIQGVSLTLQRGILSLVGRNGMGKSTLCNAIVGLRRAREGRIRVAGEEIIGRSSHEINRLGVGFVPQGRRVWPSLTVDETLNLASRRGSRGQAWDNERIYRIFPQLGDRRNSGGAELSGGEQQMLAIARALVGNPRLLIMDEPTEGLAPLIVEQVTQLLTTLTEDDGLSVLLVEQNIGVATRVSDDVAIMVNGRIARILSSHELAGDLALQRRLLGVGREDDTNEDQAPPEAEQIRDREPQIFTVERHEDAGEEGRPTYISNRTLPNRWQVPLPRRPEPNLPRVDQAPLVPSLRSGCTVWIAGTFDTKGVELRFIRDEVRRRGLATRTVDLSTSGKPSSADVPPHQVASFHPRGSSAVMTGDRGESVKAMAIAFENWILRQTDIGGIVSAGGSGGTALVAPGMRRLPVGVPKIIVSTVASGDVKQYVGASDITLMYAVTDIQGLNSISRQILANAANAIAGMVAARNADASLGRAAGQAHRTPLLGMTMFGVTTPCVQQICRRLESRFECLVFHATGTGGQSMEKLADSHLLAAIADVTTTEVCDLLVGGVFPASEDRFGAIIRTRIPYVGACGALDMVNFGPIDSVPDKFRGRNLYQHNPQVTLMRTTADENKAFGRWIGERLNRMEGQVWFFLPEGGVSLLDSPGQPFHDPAADAALFEALEKTVHQTGNRRLIRLPYNINQQQFSDAVSEGVLALTSSNRVRAGAM
jgi:uncharacterized protein (UPF0261 family)/ABC-type branched-subunit amino acid transport system ATPase component